MADSITKLLECPICLETFKSPRMLSCQHSFCVEPCLKGIVDLTRKSVQCAICRKVHKVPQEGINGFPKNLLLQDLLDVQSETKVAEPIISKVNSVTNSSKDSKYKSEADETFNNAGFKAEKGQTGKYYCGQKLDGPSCNCCDGNCGPGDGCNCSFCMQLDIDTRNPPFGYLINRVGDLSKLNVKAKKFYCGMKVLVGVPGCDGYCGPNNGPNCRPCQILQSQATNRYALVKVKNEPVPQIGITGKFYCSKPLDGPTCQCCNGVCGPTNGCNCSNCMKLDVWTRGLPKGSLVNRNGGTFPTYISRYKCNL